MPEKARGRETRRRDGRSPASRDRGRISELSRGSRAQPRQLHRQLGRTVLDHRSERRRQDLDAELYLRPLFAVGGTDRLRGARHHPPEDECPRAARHRPDVPEPGVVQSHDGSGQHHGRPTSPLAKQLPQRRALLARRRAEGRAGPPPRGRGDHRLPRNSAHPQGDGGHSALRAAQTGRAGPRHRPEAEADPARRADGRDEPRGKGGHGSLHPRPERGVGDDGDHDRARHRRRHGHLASADRPRLRSQDRRGAAARGDRRSRGQEGLSRRGREPAAPPIAAAAAGEVVSWR